MDRPPRILVIRGGAIGDFILTLPAIRLLKESIPHADIEIMGYPSIIALAEADGLASSIRNLEHGPMAKLFVPGTTLDPTLVQFFRGFNLVVSYLFDPDGYFRGNMERIGVKTFLEMPSRVLPGHGHATEQLAKPLERLAMYLDHPAPVLNGIAPTPTNDTNPKPTLAIHPGSGSLQKNWPVEHWITVGKRLHEQYPQWSLMLITGEAELERGITRTITTAWQGLPYTHWDQSPLTELAAHLRRPGLFLGHDSGIAYLAAACGRKGLLFFGPTDPDTWAPRNAGIQVWKQPHGDLQQLSLSEGWAQITAFLDQH